MGVGVTVEGIAVLVGSLVIVAVGVGVKGMGVAVGRIVAVGGGVGVNVLWTKHIWESLVSQQISSALADETLIINPMRARPNNKVFIDIIIKLSGSIYLVGSWG